MPETHRQKILIKTGISQKNGCYFSKYHMHEKSININKVDIKRIVLSNKESFGDKGSHKYFVGYIYMKVMPFRHHHA